MGQCFTRQQDGSSCCDVNNSFFGEDAFYREAFYDCEEGNRSHDVMFAWHREQARLKIRKGSVFATYAAYELSKTASSARHEMCQCISTNTQDEELEPLRSRNRLLLDNPDEPAPSFRLGTTIPLWPHPGLPRTEEGPYWSKGTGRDLKVRCGPNYRQTGQKAEANGSMYETLTVDAIKAERKIDSIIGNIINENDLPPRPKDSFCESDRGGGGTLQWTPNDDLPRIICINMMLPYNTGLGWRRKDTGCSFVGFFHVKSETLKALRTKNPPAHVKLLRDFCMGPCGNPRGDKSEPSRCLAARVKKGVKKDQQPGLFKCVAHCVNPEAVNVPDMFHTYNGKPCLITKCGYIVRDPLGEWIEIGVDVRGFNMLARKMLCSFRHLLPKTKIHYGFVIQGVENDELPEGLLCDMYLHGIDMLDDPVPFNTTEHGTMIEDETPKDTSSRLRKRGGQTCG